MNISLWKLYDMFILPSVATITTKFFAARHTSYQHEKTCHFIAYLIYKIIILINNHLTWCISSNFNRAAFLSIYNFYLFVSHKSNTRWAKIVFLRCRPRQSHTLSTDDCPHIPNCHHSPLLYACWLYYCSSLTGWALGTGRTWYRHYRPLPILNIKFEINSKPKQPEIPQ